MVLHEDKELIDDLLHFHHEHVFSILQHESVGQIVDVLGCAAEMNVLGQGVESKLLRERGAMGVDF